jgi:hypothetical protein
MTKTRAMLGQCSWILLLVACKSDVHTPGEQHTTDQAGAPAHSEPSDSTKDQAGSSASSDKPASSSDSTSNKTDTSSSAASSPANMPANTPSNSSGSMPANMPGDMQPSTNGPMPIDWHGDLRGLCDKLSTNFADDHACIPAPPAEEGMQIHIGPKDYNDANEIAKYIMHPGEESSTCFATITPNDSTIYYQTSTLSGRMGTHHIIDTMYAGDGSTPETATCSGDMMSALGSVPGASKAYMPRLSVAPEYEHVGRSIPAHAKIQADMHYYNFTDHDILREFWLNIYFAKAEDITTEASQIAALGGFGWNSNPIPPGTDKTYSYDCKVKGEGWILMLLGHYHAHGRQFTANIVRKAGGTDKVFEMFDYMEPAQFEYNSIVTNPMFSPNAAGATTGRLAVHDGDTINWQCHIVNDSDVALKYVNEVKTGEMCNLWGSSIGISPISCYLQ